MTRPSRDADHARGRAVGSRRAASSSRNSPRRSMPGSPPTRMKSIRLADSSSCSPAASPKGRMRHASVGLEARGDRFRPPTGHPRSPPRARDAAPQGRLVLGEQVRGVRHRLELERVAGGIEEEHRRLLARLAFEAHRRRDHELPFRAPAVARRAASIPPSAAPGRNAAPARPRHRPDWSSARARPGARCATI